MSKIQIMGILNVTPDSFFDGQGDQYMDNVDEYTRKLSQDLFKADIIDIGAESTRPGSLSISVKEEINRLSIIKDKISLFDHLKYSIDTYKYEVAKYALDNGFCMINDIYAGQYDDRILKLCSNKNVPIVLMHMKGNPYNMQKNTSYDSVIDDIMFFFKNRTEVAIKSGIPHENIIIDPGIGFGKSLKDNYRIIKSIPKLKELGFKILIGLSRKSFLDIDKNIPPDKRLEESIAMNAISAVNGADILRVHDVNASLKALKTVKAILIAKLFFILLIHNYGL